MSSTTLARPRSALDAFLDTTVVHERMPTSVPRPVIAMGAAGGALMLVDGLLGMMFGGADARGNSFFLAGGGDVSSILQWAARFAGPLVVVGLLALAANLAMLAIPGGWAARIVCIVEPVAGGVVALPWLFVAAMLVLNLLIWVLAIVAAVAFVGMMLGGMLSGS
jgi:hypothetical protein